jgi:hypothetical protein
MKARFVLLAALALTTLGMAIIVLATIAPGMFYVGVYFLDAGLLSLAVAGVLQLMAPPELP